jgi:prepilin-type N-terminal cleavage/methylation domain-containing protein
MRRANPRCGLTLLEVLVALSILSIGLLGIALLQITAVRSNASAHVSVLAARFAQDRLEELRREAFAGIVSSAGLTPEGRPDVAALPADPSVSSISAGRGIRIYRVWAVSETTPTLKTISVWACWRDETGRWRTVHLATQRGDVS